MTLEISLLAFFRDKPNEWHKKVSLYVLGDQLGYSPEYVGRELRKMVESGKIQVEYYKGKRNQKLAKYLYVKKPSKIPRIEIRDGVAYVI